MTMPTPPQVFIPKEVNGMPDCYSIKVNYTNGKEEEIEIVDHKIILKLGRPPQTLDIPIPFLEFITFEDETGWIPMCSISKLMFDKRWTRILDLRKEEEKKKNQ